MWYKKVMSASDVSLDEFLDLLKVLVHQPSVVGCEAAFMRTLRRELEEAGAEVSQFEGLLVATGDRLLDWFRRFDRGSQSLIVLDTSPFPDRESAAAQHVTLRNRDVGQKPLSFGRTELGRIVAATEGKVQGATLQIPTTGYHTPSETTSLEACASFLGVLGELVLN